MRLHCDYITILLSYHVYFSLSYFNKQHQCQCHHGWQTTGGSIQLQILGKTKHQSKHGACNVEIHTQITTVAMPRLEMILKSNIGLQSKFKLLQIAGHTHPRLWVWGLETPGCGRKKGSRHSRRSTTGNSKPMTIYRARSKVLWVNRNLNSPLNVERCHVLSTSHDITASARPSCKAMLMVATNRDGNAKAIQTTSKSGQDMKMLGLVRANTNRSSWKKLFVSSASGPPQWLTQSRGSWWWF